MASEITGSSSSTLMDMKAATTTMRDASFGYHENETAVNVGVTAQTQCLNAAFSCEELNLERLAARSTLCSRSSSPGSTASVGTPFVRTDPNFCGVPRGEGCLSFLSGAPKRIKSTLKFKDKQNWGLAHGGGKSYLVFNETPKASKLCGWLEGLRSACRRKLASGDRQTDVQASLVVARELCVNFRTVSRTMTLTFQLKRSWARRNANQQVGVCRKRLREL